MYLRVINVIALCCCVGSVAPAYGAASPTTKPFTPTQLEFFEKNIRPVLVNSCYRCHSAQSAKLKGGLLVDSRDGLLKGGDTGPAIVPGDVGKSLLIKAVRYGDSDLQMPPKHRLAEAQIQLLEQWIAMGAPDPRVGIAPSGKATPLNLEAAKTFWSFQPLHDATPPTVADSDWMANPIDQFVRAEQVKWNLTPAPLADRRTLIRRVTYDLTGLPPTPREVQAFVEDQSPDAWEKVVDRLLASAGYGEKWGRHWLDLARYADTSGCTSDYPIPQAYRYRNYVIDAFNQDKPYDEFLKEQLAGDLMPAKNDAQRREHIIATGYLATARRFGGGADSFYLTIDDVIDNIGKSMMGLSVGCARCHDHKFDPIFQSDYYGLYGMFQSTQFSFPGTELYPHSKDMIPLGSAEEAKASQNRAAEMAAMDARHAQLFQEILIVGGLQRGAEAEKSHAISGNLLSKFALAITPLGPARAAAGLAFDQEEAILVNKPTVASLTQEMKELRIKQNELLSHPLPIETAYGVCEGQPQDVQIFRAGNPAALGDLAPRGFLLILGGQKLPPGEKGSGRLELADWITSKQNPLTARVWVNRVWQWHFGAGIVQTPSDFGVRGKAPTNPALLDYLTTRFIDSGWSTKSLHKLICMSRAYQLASDNLNQKMAERDESIDAPNTYLWRFNPRRLEAEEVRDSLLADAGILKRGEDGPHPFPEESTWHFTQHKPFVDDYPTYHRAIYLLQQRIRKQPFLEVFDGADTNSSTAIRDNETSPVQALFFMNDPLAYESADHLATRLQLAARNDDDRQIDMAFELCLNRPATKPEIAAAHDYLAQVGPELRKAGVPAEFEPHQAMASYLRILLSSDEFFFID